MQAKRHIKRTADNPGGIITTESPLHYSNVQLVDPVTKAPVRVTWRFLEDGSKVCARGGVYPLKSAESAFTVVVDLSQHCRLTCRICCQVRVTRGKKASGSIVPRPEVLKQRRKPRPLPGAQPDPSFVQSRRLDFHFWPLEV